MGKLGACYATVLAAHGHEVVGVDRDASVVEKINNGVAPVDESHLDDWLLHAEDTLRATTDMHDAVAHSTIAFVVVPTPSDSTGGFTNRFVVSAVQEIGLALRQIGDELPHYTVAVVSTVMPGSVRGDIQRALEQASQRECGIDVSLAYCPSFIALGSVIHDLMYPDLVLIGCDDDAGGHIVERVLAPVIASEPVIHHASTVDAEVAKLGVNCALVMKVGLSNTFAELCEAIPGADARAVCRIVGSDSRIGFKYLSPGGSAGGPCLPRDATAYLAAAEEWGVEAPLMKGVAKANARQTVRIAGKVRDEKRVAVLGLSYKPDTGVTEASLGCNLVRQLTEWGVEVGVWDPVAQADVPNGTIVCTSARDAVQWASAVVVATAWPEFAGIDYLNKRVVDVWGILPPEDNIERIGVSLS